jgi:hypothetical protein
MEMFGAKWEELGSGQCPDPSLRSWQPAGVKNP